MGKDQQEIELRKLEVEKLKIKEGLFRSLVIVVLTIGAGLGAVIYRANIKLIQKYSSLIDMVLLIILGVLLFSITVITFFLWANIRKRLKEL